MKVYLAAPVATGCTYRLYESKESLGVDAPFLCVYEDFLREAGMTRKMPVGKQILTVKLTVR